MPLVNPAFLPQYIHIPKECLLFKFDSTVELRVSPSNSRSAFLIADSDFHAKNMIMSMMILKAI